LKEAIMKKMWWLYILGGLVVLLGVAFLFGVNGMKATLGLQLKDVDLSGVPDGTYKGTYQAGRFKDVVEVTVQNHRIVGVTPLGTGNSKGVDKKVFENSLSPAIAKIIETQSPDVDAVSGATATTNSMLGAVEDALLRAGGRVLAK
jgi:uncharacterized protein with FMN-binding domain